MFSPATQNPASVRAHFIRDQLPPQGLFAGQEWRIAPDPFPLGAQLTGELESLGRVLLQFYRAVNLLYRQSSTGKKPAWIADWLDRGKPAELIALQRHPAFKNEIPRVIRPDLLLSGSGISITELDSVPGGIGLTAWLNRTYSLLERNPSGSGQGDSALIGGGDGMINGFSSIFSDAPQAHIVVSEESSSYRPEMTWLAREMDPSRFTVRSPQYTGFSDGDAVYRFFELFDVANVPNSQTIFKLAAEKKIRLTPPPKPIFEEKMLFALLWNRHLRDFWRQELGSAFLERLQQLTPYTWLIDPTPLPPQAVFPELNLTDWEQLKTLSHRERELVLKVSGFSESAWGARGVYLGSDLAAGPWAEAVDLAIQSVETSPFVLQRFHKPSLVESAWFDFEKDEQVSMPGRVRLCPFYFVSGDADAARAQLGGVLATICPADKKIIHGMKEAILAPCSQKEPEEKT
jgi:hypothetical protein